MTTIRGTRPILVKFTNIKESWAPIYLPALKKVTALIQFPVVERVPIGEEKGPNQQPLSLFTLDLLKHPLHLRINGTI